MISRSDAEALNSGPGEAVPADRATVTCAIDMPRASGHDGDIRRATHGYEPTREAAMAAFAKSWRRLGNRTN